ncbi:hypothetical protein SAMN05421805_104181 [Saccharopolyspora antimicrobica]|uniref:Uncharacterized protein n=1 Tax=Saccharopolyspora antimicrobica TaxID=455193 RepID=A0A1I4YK46_9PSEU|nr:hypothetical protein [Saccharopolyspora antimicrobica]RKT82710.1 hypothetical protein ATL45_0965 [Saccharopolyspora antimicrobica]SFN38392.1 hypothetical protein SAMN05421805_104181 [Saccharopolyspora antimicrobica]
MTWRVARSLETLRQQFNTAFPARSKASDGGIGDTNHQNRTSDHNPWAGPAPDGRRLVTARDFTHDPAAGLDIDRITDELAASRDPRIKYLIANGLILDTRPGFNPWRWTPYRGANPHRKHFHISVHSDVALADDPRPWNLPSLTRSPAPPPAQEGPDLTPEENHMLRDILQQLTGSRIPGQFPGWPSFVDGTTQLTPVDTIRHVDKHVIELRDELARQAETLHGIVTALGTIPDTVRAVLADATVNVVVNVQGAPRV